MNAIRKVLIAIGVVPLGLLTLIFWFSASTQLNALTGEPIYLSIIILFGPPLAAYSWIKLINWIMNN